MYGHRNMKMSSNGTEGKDPLKRPISEISYLNIQEWNSVGKKSGDLHGRNCG